MARSQRTRKRVKRLSAWQTLLAAGVAALATVAAALIATLDGPGPSPNPTPSPSGPALVAITSWTESTLSSPSRERYSFSGIARNLPPGSMIYVVAQSGQPIGADGIPGGWLVSVPAYPASDGTWHITWTLPHPPGTARWTPVVWVNDCGPGNTCGEGPVPELEHAGPAAGRVVGRTVGRM